MPYTVAKRTGQIQIVYHCMLQQDKEKLNFLAVKA